MPKRLTTEEFIKRAKEKHGDKYDYSKSEYLGYGKKLLICCPIHGYFTQRPNHHLQGVGCPKCFFESRKEVHFNVCKNDYNEYNDTLYHQAHHIWRGMLIRGFDNKVKKKAPTYKDCSICEDWRTFTNFFKWFKQHYVEGWVIDKDILVKRNKEYHPDKCCFVPPSINSLFVKGDKRRGDYPIGVRERNGRFLARITKNYKTYQIGVYNDVISAFNAYKKAKEQYIKEVADKWKDKLEPYVYEAMYNYKVEITD